MRGDGAFVIVWQDRDADGQGIFGRRFDANGSSQGVQFRVNQSTAGDQTQPAVAQDANGSFMVVWQDRPFFEIEHIRGRRFNSAGVPQDASDLGIKSAALAGEVSYGGPAVASNTSSHFVVTWTRGYNVGGTGDAGVFGRRLFDPEFQVNTYTTDGQFDTDVAMDNSGNFVVVWSSHDQDGSGYGIFARRFSSGGTALGGEFQVNSYSLFDQFDPAVAMSSGGGFVVVWQRFGQDGPSIGIFARRFGAAGNPESGDFQVSFSAPTPGAQYDPDVAVGGDGSFVVAWRQAGEVFARTFDAAGTPRAVEFQVNTYTTSVQRLPAVAADGDGNFVVVWPSSGQDGSGTGVFAQRFVKLSPFDVDADGTLAPLTDGLLVLRFLFGFTGTPLINGAVDPDCTRCTAPAIEAYLQGLL
jgi:hypothetical protein